jgi:hypothetical protein
MAQNNDESHGRWLAFLKRLPVESQALVVFAATKGYFDNPDNAGHGEVGLSERELFTKSDETLLRKIKKELDLPKGFNEVFTQKLNKIVLSRITQKEKHTLFPAKKKRVALKTVVLPNTKPEVAKSKPVRTTIPSIWPSEPYFTRSDGTKYNGSGRELLPFIDLYRVVGPLRCPKTGRFIKKPIEQDSGSLLTADIRELIALEKDFDSFSRIDELPLVDGSEVGKEDDE